MFNPRAEKQDTCFRTVTNPCKNPAYKDYELSVNSFIVWRSCELWSVDKEFGC